MQAAKLPARILTALILGWSMTATAQEITETATHSLEQVAEGV